MDPERKARHKRYIQLMGEVKVRLVHIERLSATFVSVNGRMRGDNVFVYEAMSLQLRKVLELIAFSALVANEQSIEALFPDIGTLWRAKAIIKKVEELNPDFFPKTARTERGEAMFTLHVEPDPEAFSVADFEQLYDALSEVVHSKNPHSKKPIKPIGRPFTEWVERIRTLLKLHVVFLHEDDVQLVDMLDWSNGTVTIMDLVKTDLPVPRK